MTMGMLMNKGLGDMFYLDDSVPTTMHMVRLNDGMVKTIQADEFSFVVHFANSYEDKDGKIIVEAPDVHNQWALFGFLRENYENPDYLSTQIHGSTFKRWTFDFEAGTVER